MAATHQAPRRKGEKKEIRTKKCKNPTCETEKSLYYLSSLSRKIRPAYGVHSKANGRGKIFLLSCPTRLSDLLLDIERFVLLFAFFA